MGKRLKLGTKEAFNTKSPRWANITFYILFGLMTAISVWIYSTKLISEPVKPEIQLLITVLTPFFYGLKKALGYIDQEEEALGI